MAWFGILKALVLATRAFTNWLRNRQLIEAGLAGAVPSNLNSVLNEILAPEKARDIVRVSVKLDPERLRDDDGFKRHD